jgi:hypothetical protein
LKEIKSNSRVTKYIDDFKINSYTYKTNQSIHHIKNKIENLIHQKGITNIKYNLAGQLNTDNTFELSRIYGVILINGGSGGPPVTIKGKLIEKENLKTDIEIDLKPNLVLVILPITFGIIAIATMANAILTENKENLFGGFFLLAIPMFWAMIKHSKKYYKSEFEKALDLVSIEIIRKK